VQALGSPQIACCSSGDVRYVWRHLPLSDVHPHAQLAAEASEAAEGADLSNVAGTPTFFVNGRRHYGAYDIRTLAEAVHAADARAALAA
jgi:protein-disulfide isomerase